MRIKPIVCSWLLLSTINCFGQSVEDAEIMLKDTVNTVLETLSNKEIAKEESREKVLSVFNRAFDFPLMAKLCLGSKYWRTVKENQQVEYTDLFIERLQESYMEKLELYSDEKVTFEEPSKKSRKLHIPTFLLSNEERISMLYKLYNNKGTWYVYDLEIQGVSIISTYRSQYTQILKDGSFDDLINKMKEKMVGEVEPFAEK